MRDAVAEVFPQLAEDFGCQLVDASAMDPMGDPHLRCVFSASSPRMTASRSKRGRQSPSNRATWQRGVLRSPAIKRPSDRTTMGCSRPSSAMLAARPAMSPIGCPHYFGCEMVKAIKVNVCEELAGEVAYRQPTAAPERSKQIVAVEVEVDRQTTSLRWCVSIGSPSDLASVNRRWIMGWTTRRLSKSTSS